MRRLNVNDTIGDYRVLGYLGEGGMGIVYRGVHEKLGRPTAIKVLGSSATDPSFKSRFMNEARLQAGLHHPNVATLYDFRDYGDELVIFMELVDGDCLDELVERRAFTIDEALTVFASVCGAVEYIHDLGIIHRDIKAQNVKLTVNGVVKLLDFGIAKDGASHGLTQTGGIIGTPNYLSPGQLQGNPASVQSDIWALGVLFYEMMTGQLPFRGDTLVALVGQISAGRYSPPEALNPAVPRQVSRIIKKCLEKDPNARYRDAGDLGLEVRAVLRSRNPSIGPSDLRAAVARSQHGGGEAVRNVSVTAPSYTYSTGLTQRTRVRLVVASVVGGGVLIFLMIVVGSYLFWGPAETSGQVKGSRRVSIQVPQGEAIVLRGGREVGPTPYEIFVGPDETVKLTLRGQGCEDKEIEVEPDDGALSYRLECNE